MDCHYLLKNLPAPVPTSSIPTSLLTKINLSHRVREVSFGVRDILIGFQDIMFLPYIPHLYTSFLIICGGGEGLGTATCLKTVLLINKDTLPVKYLRSDKSSLLCQSNVMVIIRLRES